MGVILVDIQSKCWAIGTRITPNMDTFHAVFCHSINFLFPWTFLKLTAAHASMFHIFMSWFITDTLQHISYLVKKCNCLPGSTYLLKANNINTGKKVQKLFNVNTKKRQHSVNDIIVLSLLLTWNIFHTSFVLILILNK